MEGVLGPGHGQQLLHASRIYQQFCKPVPTPIFSDEILSLCKPSAESAVSSLCKPSPESADELPLKCTHLIRGAATYTGRLAHFKTQAGRSQGSCQSERLRQKWCRTI